MFRTLSTLVFSVLLAGQVFAAPMPNPETMREIQRSDFGRYEKVLSEIFASNSYWLCDGSTLNEKVWGTRFVAMTQENVESADQMYVSNGEQPVILLVRRTGKTEYRVSFRSNSELKRITGLKSERRFLKTSNVGTVIDPNFEEAYVLDNTRKCEIQYYSY